MPEAIKINCNQSGGKCNIDRAQIDGICKRFHVAHCHCRCFWRLADDGRIVGRESSRWLFGCRNCKRAYNTIVMAMSRDIAHLFPPKTFRAGWMAHFVVKSIVCVRSPPEDGRT